MLRNVIKNMNKKKKKGFTLIELIIVIAIIAILAAIALPKFMDVRENSNIKADISNAKNIQLVVASLIADDKIQAPTSTAIGFLVSNSTDTVNKLQTVPKIKAKDSSNKGNDFYVEIGVNGEVRILTQAGTTGIEIYPKASSAPYNN